MKSKILSVAIIIMIFIAGFVSANNLDEVISVVLNKVNVEINGVKMQSDNILYKGRTYVQLNEVAEALKKDIAWNGKTFTASILDKSNLLVTDQLPTVNAKFVGEVEHKYGSKWYVVESKYTKVYFFNDAVELEWIMEDIDNQFEYLLDFRNLTWDGYKLPIYFYGKDTKLSSDSAYYSSSYNLQQQLVTMSADIHFELVNYISSDGTEIQFREDPRITLVHEMSHHLNNPDNMSTTDKWLEEGLAYYLAYNYSYTDVDTSIYPDYAKRKFIDLVFSASDTYSIENFLSYLELEFEHYTKEANSSVLSFEGIAKSHYGMLEEKTVSPRYLEPIVIEFLIDTYGKDKLLELYIIINNYNGKSFDLKSDLLTVYGKDIKVLEAEFRNYTNLSKYYLD